MAEQHPKISKRARVALIGLIAFCSLIEAMLFAGDLNLLGLPRLRDSAYEYAGFWVGLLYNWQPNYPFQPWSMYVTYGFFHGGPLHLIVNMITLWSLGLGVIARVKFRGFALLYGGALLGGAAGFGLLSDSVQPMVGASGALFGLAGGLLAWDYVDRFTLSERLWPIARVILLLIAMNLVMWWALNGQLAWETHLGGFVFGWVTALLIDPRGPGARDEERA